MEIIVRVTIGRKFKKLGQTTKNFIFFSPLFLFQEENG